MTECVTPVQLAKDICRAVFGELYGIGFLDTLKAGFAYPTVEAVKTRVGQQVMIDAETLLLMSALSTERNDADATIAEIAGVQVFVKQGEIRAKLRVAANYDVWAIMEKYNYFTGKSAFLYEKNSTITYINDGGSTPTAYGLPLGMVQVDKCPLFSNGTDPAEFYMMVNIDSNSLTGIERAALDFPIHTLNPVKASS